MKEVQRLHGIIYDNKIKDMEIKHEEEKHRLTTKYKETKMESTTDEVKVVILD